ncbi:MAG TPA: helix-turn-helix domain-containing protein [Thermoleophilaceae bacterium]|nr:helix-turn-helix domain-containing protein [Thermoleophilaceae bacterium]
MSASLEQTFHRLASRLVESVDDVVDAYFERLTAEEPYWGRERPELFDTYRAISRASILAELECLRDGARPPDVLPEADLEFARGAARIGAQPTDLGQAYRRGHACHWEAWFDLVEAEGLDREQHRILLARGSDFFFDYATQLSRMTLEEYTHERDLMLSDREQRRVHLVHEILAGNDVDPAVLGYDPAGSNLAFVAWGEAASEVARALSVVLARPLLVVGVLENETWGWLGGSAGRDTSQRLARADLPGGAALAFGDDATGTEGFVLSHEQARRAERAGRRSGSTITHYADVALESLAAVDEAAASAFVARELSGIDGEDLRAQRLRGTLSAWFAAGQNAAAAAAALGVHEQTVAQRLRTVEERTGRPVAARRAELETALRLRELLD